MQSLCAFNVHINFVSFCCFGFLVFAAKYEYPWQCESIALVGVDVLGDPRMQKQ